MHASMTSELNYVSLHLIEKSRILKLSQNLALDTWTDMNYEAYEQCAISAQCMHVCQRCTCVYVEPLIRQLLTEHKLMIIARLLLYKLYYHQCIRIGK